MTKKIKEFQVILYYRYKRRAHSELLRHKSTFLSTAGKPKKYRLPLLRMDTIFLYNVNRTKNYGDKRRSYGVDTSLLDLLILICCSIQGSDFQIQEEHDWTI